MKRESVGKREKAKQRDTRDVVNAEETLNWGKTELGKN